MAQLRQAAAGSGRAGATASYAHNRTRYTDGIAVPDADVNVSFRNGEALRGLTAYLLLARRRRPEAPAELDAERSGRDLRSRAVYCKEPDPARLLHHTSCPLGLRRQNVPKA